MITYEYIQYENLGEIYGVQVPEKFDAGGIRLRGKSGTEFKWNVMSGYFAKHFKLLLNKLKMNDSSLILYLYGPLLDCELLPFLKHIFNYDFTGRSMLHEVFSPPGDGYVDGSVVFDYDDVIIGNIFSDKNCSLQMDTILFGASVPFEGSTEYFSKKYMENEGLGELLDKCDVFFEIDSDFIGVDLYSKIFSVEEFFVSTLKSAGDEIRIFRRSTE